MRSRNQRSWLITTAQPGNAQQRVLERPEGVHVEIVGGLVEEEDVAAATEHLGQEHPVALPS